MFKYTNRFLKNKQVIYFEIPNYPELATKNVWSKIKDNPDLMVYFPDLEDNQLPEKKFMYGVLSTLHPDAVRDMVAENMKNRAPIMEEDKGELVEVCGELKDSISCLFEMKSK